MGRHSLGIPLAVQIGVVVVLLAAALGTLWFTSSAVVKREERRARSNDLLKEATDRLEVRGKDALAAVRAFPDYMDSADWSALDRRLSEEARQIGLQFPGVEAGYYVPARREKPFLPPLPDERIEIKVSKSPAHAAASVTPTSLYDYVDTQVDAAFRKGHELSVVEDIPPYTIAIRTAPVRVKGAIVAATWAMIRLVDPIYLDQSASEYRLFAGLALVGIALSLVLTVRLARTVRSQAAERARLQTELQRSERLAALGKLLAGVAHEVRNPLAGIRSTAQLWQRGIGLDDEALGGLVDEVDRLEGIVSRLLQFSKAGAQDHAPDSLNAVVTEAARLAAGSAEAKEIRVEVELEPGLPAVMMSPSALIQVFRNLTTNAIQAMREGGTLRLETRRDPSGRCVEASVSDTGPGLPPAVLKHLFEPFFTTKAEGTGLGLAIAREIVLAHRGELQVANRSDRPGAIFTLTLPTTPQANHRGNE